jgi:hypothetical protein
VIKLLKKFSKIEAKIYATILYFDCLNYVLSREEIFRNLIGEGLGNYQDFLKGLNGLLKEKMISERDGFFCRNGREELFKVRYLRNAEADWKWKRVERIVKWFRLIPFTRGVVGSGSLAIGNTTRESDLDLLVLVKPGRIWTNRVLVSALTACLGVRRHDNLWENRVCLNHYKTTNNLWMKYQSLYNAQVYAHWFPLLNFDLFKKLQKENEGWMKKYLGNFTESEIIDKRVVGKSRGADVIRRFFEFILGGSLGNWIEKKLKRAQIRRIEKKGGKYIKGGRIVLEDNELSFHPDSPERQVLDCFNKKSKEAGLRSDWKDSGLG